MQLPSSTPKDGWIAPQPKPHVIKSYKLSEIRTEEVHWLWYPYIPAGKLSMLEGDPGQGKSWITCSLAADLSAGRALPGQKAALPPQNVLMLSAEDGLGDTVRPRIESLGGILENITVSDDHFILDVQGIKEMEDLIQASAATIVFMDPLVAYMGSQVDMHRANEVRGLMAQLAETAKRTGTAIVAVRHLRKAAAGKSAGKAIYSGIGSIDFTAAVRSVVQVQETKSGQKYMYHAKHNLTPKGPSLAYNFADGAFKWEGILNEDETNDAPARISTRPKAIAMAEDFLHELLKDGPVPSNRMFEEAARRGINQHTLIRAKKGLVGSRKGQSGWEWYLEARADIDAPVSTLIKASNPEEERLIQEALARLNAASKV